MQRRVARFEVRLALEGEFRFLVDEAQTSVVKEWQRKIKAGTVVDILADYINLLEGQNKRLARFVFCGSQRRKRCGGQSRIEIREIPTMRIRAIIPLLAAEC